MSMRTGPDTPLLAAATPATTETNLETFVAGGNSVNLTVTTVTGGAGNLTLTLDSASDGTTFADVHDSGGEVSWVFDVNTADVYDISIPYAFAVGTTYRFAYKCGVAAGTIAINALSWEDPAGPRVLTSSAYDSSTDSQKVTEQDPISDHHIETTLADVTNGTDGTYYYYFDMDGYKFFGGDTVISGGSGTCTVSFEAGTQDDGTAQASISYKDISIEWFGAANWTASDIYTMWRPCPHKYVRIKVVASTGAADDADWAIDLKRSN